MSKIVLHLNDNIIKLSWKCYWNGICSINYFKLLKINNSFDILIIKLI